MSNVLEMSSARRSGRFMLMEQRLGAAVRDKLDWRTGLPREPIRLLLTRPVQCDQWPANRVDVGARLSGVEWLPSGEVRTCSGEPLAERWRNAP